MHFKTTLPWAVLVRLLTTWWSPGLQTDALTEEDLLIAEERIGCLIPHPLQAWYGKYGRRSDCVGGGDRLLSPEELRFHEDMLIFCIENQGNCCYAVARAMIGDNDPSVVIDTSEWVNAPGVTTPRWESTGCTLTEFLLGMVLEATWLSASFTGDGELSSETYAQLIREFPFTIEEHSALGSIAIAENIILQSRTDRETGEIILRVSALTWAAFAHFLRIVGSDWGYLEHKSEWWAHPYHEECREGDPKYIWRQRPYEPPPNCAFG